jgi:hypothetical protein
VKINKSKTRRLGYGVAGLVLVLGFLAAAILIISKLSTYPTLIADAYKSPLQKVEVPGAVDLELSREGAYAVYYEEQRGAYNDTERPPNLNCQLISKMTSKEIPLVADYVPTNRYATRDDRVGVLIYSTTVEDPGLHTLSCDYADGDLSPKLVLAVGPNYFFEFLRVAWNLGGSVLGGAGVLCASSMLAVVIAIVVFLRSRTQTSGEVKA